MINAIYGTKVGMTQLFDEDGTVIPVTIIEAAPNTVCQMRPPKPMVMKQFSLASAPSKGEQGEQAHGRSLR